MKKTVLLLTVSFLLLLTTSLVNATTFFDEVKVGARPIAMGGAYVALGDDAYALYWNPAGISEITEKPQFVSMYAPNRLEIEDYNLTALGFIYPSEYGVFAGNYTSQGANLEEWNQDQINISDSNEKKVGLGYGYQLNKHTNLGFSLYHLGYTIADYSETGYALDLGGQFKVNKQWAVGIVVNNLINELGVDEYNPWFQVGLGYRSDELPFSLEADIKIAEDPEDYSRNKTILRLGGEYRFNDIFAVRLGSDDGTLSAGLGIEKDNLFFDYAISLDELGNTHIISGGCTF